MACTVMALYSYGLSSHGSSVRQSSEKKRNKMAARPSSIGPPIDDHSPPPRAPDAPWRASFVDLTAPGLATRSPDGYVSHTPQAKGRPPLENGQGTGILVMAY